MSPAAPTHHVSGPRVPRGLGCGMLSCREATLQPWLCLPGDPCACIPPAASRAGTGCPGREGQENSRSPVLPLPGAPLALGLCCPLPLGGARLAAAGRGSAPVFHPRAKRWQVEEELARPTDCHYQPLLFTFLCAVHPTPDPPGSEGPAQIEAAAFWRGNVLFPFISRQSGEPDP